MHECRQAVSHGLVNFNKHSHQAPAYRVDTGNLVSEQATHLQLWLEKG